MPSEIRSSTSRSFQDVELWKRAHQWVLDVYRYSSRFPKAEMFVLTSQVRRAAISIPANFAEGFKKRTQAEKLRFYNIAQGSIEESRYYLILAQDLGYGESTKLYENLECVSKMLEAYSRALANSK